MDPIIGGIIAFVVVFGVGMIILSFVFSTINTKETNKRKEAARKAVRNSTGTSFYNQSELEKAYEGVVNIKDGEAVLLAEKLKKRLGL